MANIASARKRARQSETSRVHNVALRSRLRTYIKKTLNSIESGDVKQAEACYLQAVPFIDSAVTKGLIHKNKAARSKSRLNAKIREMKT